MNYLATLPPKKRFYAALVCLPLIYLIVKGVTLGTMWAGKVGGIPAILVVGSLCCVAAWKMQHIAAAIVSLFYRGE
ncbi:MAG: hypothetical protein EPN70_18785 [Paraburkholderia sp.]|jgi:hypothetical protein|uniref:hypothetical protein n=1 Tax=Paraburkholderia sp. TaxID=1926495 RepID=UPI00120E41C8|nr:hypothetical protein [Paraburkholderia sp.]TAM01703.1 MAG: hypothetical protein EPN70_18785 [Paraburkholderia sp.]